jgi:hypothetical protein
MNKNMFDPNMFKDIEKMMSNISNMTSKPMVDVKSIKKYVLIILLSLVLAGFGIGLLIGLLF